MVKKALRERQIPFSIEAPLDPFYSERNMAQIAKAEQQVNDGKVIVKPMKELDDMERE